jgi:hypothetical protein
MISSQSVELWGTIAASSPSANDAELRTLIRSALPAGSGGDLDQAAGRLEHQPGPGLLCIAERRESTRDGNSRQSAVTFRRVA